MAVAEAIVLGQSPLNSQRFPLAPVESFCPLPLMMPSTRLRITRSFIRPGSPPTLETGAILDDPPDSASYLAHVMSGGPPVGAAPPVDSSIVRMNPMISPVLDDSGNFILPPGLDEDAFTKLVKLDMDAVRRAEVDEITNFARLWLLGSVANQPVRMDWNHMPEIGQKDYALAKAAWQLLVPE